MGRLEEQLTQAERAVAGGDTDPELLLRLGMLYLRADRPGDARAVLGRAWETMSGVVHDAAGEVELNLLRDDVREALDQAEALERSTAERGRRDDLAARLLAGTLEPGEHDELIRLEVAAGLEELHAEVPQCPACFGPVAPNADGSVRCARTGAGGDLCRHMDAKGLYACARCGLVVRAWIDRKVRKLDTREPPMIRPDKSRCDRCDGRVADWKRHFLRCPKARPAEFPVCAVCRRRGFHRTTLSCPRCRGRITETPCMEQTRNIRR